MLGIFLQTVNADVIVNKTNTIDSISKDELYDIVTGRVKYYDNGERILLVVLPKSHKSFVRLASLYGFSPIQLQRIIARIGKNHRTRITEVSSELSAVSLIVNEYGGISYVTETYDTVKNLELDR